LSKIPEIKLVSRTDVVTVLLDKLMQFVKTVTIILPVVRYGCETWSLTLKKEHRLRVFVNRALTRIFESKRNEVTGGFRKLHNEELRNLHTSPNIIRIIKSRRMRWAGHVARMGKRNACRILVGMSEGKRPLRRPSRRWVR
jgi:hypothetical protein